MKKTVKLWSLMAFMAIGLATTFTLTACGDDDDEPSGSLTQQEYAEQCFSIPNGKFHNTTMPSSTTSAKITGISISKEAQAGETSVINIVSEVEYDRFYVGLEGKTGYVEVNAASVTRAVTMSYAIPLTFGAKSVGNQTIVLKARRADGELTQPSTQHIGVQEPFGADMGLNNIAKIAGIWRYEYEQEDDMGTIRIDLRFMGTITSGEVADFLMEEYTIEDGNWDGAWHYQVEGQYKLKGSTLRLYYKRARQRSYKNNEQWSDWVTQGSAGLVSPTITWQSNYNTWKDFLAESEGNEVWECLINDAKDKMQLRRLRPLYEYDPVSGNTHVSYVYYDSEAEQEENTRHFVKI